MAAIPWKLIVDATLPALIEQAGKLFRKADASAQAVVDESGELGVEETLDSLVGRVAKLEGMEAEQAKLLQETLQTLKDISTRVSSLQARASAAVVVSALALIGCVAAWMIG